MFENFIVGKYKHADSFLHRLDPRAKIIGFFVLSTTIMFLSMVKAFLFFYVLLILAILNSRIKFFLFIKNFRPIIIFLSIIYLMHIFLGEGIITANIIISRLILLIGFSTIVTITTQINKLTKGLEKLLSFLRFFKINPSTIALMIGLAIRFIPVFLFKIDNIIRALKGRGVIFNQGNIKVRAEKYALVVKLILRALDNYANNLSISMRVRGFNVDVERTSSYNFVMNMNDYIFIGMIFCVFVFFLIL